MKHFFVILLAAALAACGSKETKIPKSVIQPEPFAAVLADIHFAESVATEKELTGKEASDFLEKEYATIFAIHDITSEEFQKSYAFYIDHPPLINKVYLMVIEILGTREEQRLLQ